MMKLVILKLTEDLELMEQLELMKHMYSNENKEKEKIQLQKVEDQWYISYIEDARTQIL